MAGSELSSGIDHTDKSAQKNKGGRKLIYATQEERKQRNREAQAALRERRSEHIKELENKIDAMKDEMAKTQTLSSTLTDQYLMLKYKNSLLERILLEKGVDVQAELNVKLNPQPLEPSNEEKKSYKPKSNAQQVSQPAETSRPISKPTKHLVEGSCCRCRPNCETDRPVAFECPSADKPNRFTSITPMVSPLQIDVVQPVLFQNKRRRYLSPNSTATHARKYTSSIQNPVPYQFSYHSPLLVPDTDFMQPIYNVDPSYNPHFGDDPFQKREAYYGNGSTMHKLGIDLDTSVLPYGSYGLDGDEQSCGDLLSDPATPTRASSSDILSSVDMCMPSPNFQDSYNLDEMGRGQDFSSLTVGLGIELQF